METKTKLMGAAFDVYKVTEICGRVDLAEGSIIRNQKNLVKEMSQTVQACIDGCFDSFRTDDAETILASTLRSCYQAHLHPKVISGEFSEDEAFLALLSNFKDHDNNGRIHRKDWCEYHACLAAKMREDHFCKMMCQVYKCQMC